MTGSLYIGLSRLSTGEDANVDPKQGDLSAEARRILGLLDRPGPLDRDPRGRPYFTDKHADFSISHSRNMAAVGWISGGGAIPRVGCDIQWDNPQKTRSGISRNFFHAAEQDYIAAGGEESRGRFCQVWVLKESWLKMRGRSVFDIRQSPVFYFQEMFHPPEEPASAREDADFFLYEIAASADERYFLSLARERNQSPRPEAPEIRWFSRPPLRVRPLPSPRGIGRV
jgi:phosphopantetheinyl transferase